MKKTAIMRIIAMLALVLVGAAAGVTAYFGVLRPVRAKPSPETVEVTPGRLARGTELYLLADCDGCHSPRDFSRFGGPVIPGSRGRGLVLPREIGLPGTVVAPNITPEPESGLGRWTDGEKIRAVREGIGRDGGALFPFMPYESFRTMSDGDVRSLVAFLNSLEPARNALPRSRIPFPDSILIRTAPKPVPHVPEPDRANSAAYGRYLAAVARCAECHTPEEEPGGKDMLFAGGRLFRGPGAVVASANITPDARTGIGAWSERDFLNRFFQYRDYVENGSPLVGPEGFTVMPWLNYSQLPPEDLKAIYAFRRTVKPVNHAVETRPARPWT